MQRDKTIELAPGDLQAPFKNWDNLQVVRVTSSQDPLFHRIFSKLWNEFGPQGEMEQEDILIQRMEWSQASAGSKKFHSTQQPYSLHYEMIGILEKEELVAVRDHTVIIHRSESPEAIVHLSHVLIDPQYRGTGMVGWLRAWPIDLVRSNFELLGIPRQSPVTLVAEMEPADHKQPATLTRLRSYQKAGFLMVDPRKVHYFQPDFRTPTAIDSGGGPKPLPLRLILRRVGLEKNHTISEKEVKSIISLLYEMYGTCFRQQDMKPLWDQLNKWTAPATSQIQLLKPMEQAG